MKDSWASLLTADWLRFPAMPGTTYVKDSWASLLTADWLRFPALPGTTYAKDPNLPTLKDRNQPIQGRI